MFHDLSESDLKLVRKVHHKGDIWLWKCRAAFYVDDHRLELMVRLRKNWTDTVASRLNQMLLDVGIGLYIPNNAIWIGKEAYDEHMENIRRTAVAGNIPVVDYGRELVIRVLKQHGQLVPDYLYNGDLRVSS